MKKAIVIIFVVMIIAGVIILRAHDNYTFVKLVENKDNDAVKQILENGYNPNVYKYVAGIPTIFEFNPTPLVAACRNGDMEMVQLLISYGADVNKMDKFTRTPPIACGFDERRRKPFSHCQNFN